MSHVTMRGLSKSFGSRQVLRGVDLEVKDGEILAVLGPSGCGKTTLLRILAGFLDPDDGEVLFDDAPVAVAGGSVPAWERRVGYVPQEGALFPHLDVRGNILFGLPRRERTAERLEEMLRLAELPPDVASAYPRELSGGQQQRVALARALAPRPRVVLLDEPFSSLDAALRISAGREVTRVLRHAGTTALLVTHDQGEALSLADRVAVMSEGRISQVDRPTELYAAPASAGVGTFVGDANLLVGRLVADGADCALGVVGLPSRPMAEDGATVTLLVRPEHLRLCATAPGRCVAEVDEVVFYGPHASVRLLLQDGTALVARADPAAVPARGAVVGVEVTGVAGVWT
jgi:iron(III) transport system ATP-binding protein